MLITFAFILQLPLDEHDPPLRTAAALHMHVEISRTNPGLAGTRALYNGAEFLNNTHGVSLSNQAMRS